MESNKKKEGPSKSFKILNMEESVSSLGTRNGGNQGIDLKTEFIINDKTLND